MKNVLKFLFAFSLITFVSCGGDDECTIDDFVGVYNGTIECPDEEPASGILTITKNSDTSITVTDTDNVTFTMDVAGCVATSSESLFGVEITQTLTLDGDKLDYRAVNSVLGIEVVCTGSMTRN